MPCLYAHHTFGEKVRKRLPEEMQECIATYEEQFHLGLQGPDFLFFFFPLSKNPINQLGHRIHHRTGSFYLKKVIGAVREKGQYSPECAYLLGFLCHFMLDSQCHPYVNQQAAETGIGHVDLEGEFDKFLMKKDGKRPETYPLWKHIPTDRFTVDTLSVLYPWIRKRHIAASLRSFRFCKWILTARNPVKKQILIILMRSAGLYEKLAGHYLWDELKKGAEKTCLHLYELYEEEIDETVQMLCEVFEMIGSRERVRELPRLERDFSGRADGQRDRK